MSLPLEILMMVRYFVLEELREVILHYRHPSPEQQLWDILAGLKGLPVDNPEIVSWYLSEGRVAKLNGKPRTSIEIIVPACDVVPNMRGLKRLERLNIDATGLMMSDAGIFEILKIPTLIRATIWLPSDGKKMTSIRSRTGNYSNEGVASLMRRSKIRILDLLRPQLDTSPSAKWPIIFVFVPKLEELTLCLKGARAFTQLDAEGCTLQASRLRALRITNSNRINVIKQKNVMSLLRRCPKLEELEVEGAIKLKLEEVSMPLAMPNLVTFEGRIEYLTLIHAPNLRRAVIKEFTWDGGATINRLAAMTRALQTVVIELALTMHEPAIVMEEVERWVQGAAARWDPLWEDKARFSLVIRAAPLKEWVYSACVGRASTEVLFIEYVRRRHEITA